MENICSTTATENNQECTQKGKEKTDPTYDLVNLNDGGELVKLVPDKEIRKKIELLSDEGIREKINPLPDEEIKKKIEGYLDNHRNGEGESELVKLLRDEKFKEKIQRFLYGNGEGENKPITEVIKRREEERLKKQEYTHVNNRRKSSKVESDSENRREGCSEKFVCWDINERGKVGETILHICLLMKNSTNHRRLAKMLVKVFPNLVHDIYLGEEYYGESPLHMAIVNEDTDMVEFLLKNGADVTERCFGAFFLPDDLKESCTVYPGSAVCQKTNYEGLTYWGEYPLSFAASLGQKEIFELLLKKAEENLKKAEKNMEEAEQNIHEAESDEKRKEAEEKKEEAAKSMKKYEIIKSKDFNGNTALHMTVIHDQKDMYDLARKRGADPNIRNKQGLTPLNLAATLARKEMFDHILEYEREVYWTYGDVTCAAYALDGFDTIDENGEIDRKSALHIIVNKKGQEHLDLMDGIVWEILKEKWQCGRYYFYIKWFLFFVYLAILTANLYLRPGQDPYATTKEVNVSVGEGYELQNITVSNDCYLLNHHTKDDQIRIAFEVMSLVGATLFLAFFIKEIKDNGLREFRDKNLWHPSANGVFLVSIICLLLAVPGRIACIPVYEDVMVMFSLLLTCPYFIYFLSPFKFIGPFLGMIDKMLWGDLLKFFAIYLVFLVGFSQAMYIAFIGTPSTLFNDPINALLGLFIMSLGEFQDIYASFDDTRYINLPKLLFVVYMILVTLLLINMLIAMMGNTFKEQTKDGKEWHRQWAKIILGNELAFPPNLRLKMQDRYAQSGRDAKAERKNDSAERSAQSGGDAKTEQQSDSDARSAAHIHLQTLKDKPPEDATKEPSQDNESAPSGETSTENNPSACSSGTGPQPSASAGTNARKAESKKLKATKVYVTRRHKEQPA